MRKNGSFLGFCAGSRWAEPPRGGAGGTMTSGPMEFRGPTGFRGSIRGPMEMTLTNQFVELQWPFFYQNPIKIKITSKSTENYGIFLFFFGVHNAGNVQYVSWSRPHVWLSAPLQTINEYIYCFLWQIISCSLTSLLIIAVRNLQRFSDRGFVTAYRAYYYLEIRLDCKM